MNLTPQNAMLVAGIVLFAVAVGLLIFATVRKRTVKPAMILVSLAIVMIGFPTIQSVKLPGFELTRTVDEVASNTVALQNNSTDEAAKTRLAAAVQKLETQVSTNEISAKDAETLARGQAALGRTDLAIHWASVAVKKAPELASAQTLLQREQVTKMLPDDFEKNISAMQRVDLASAVSQLGARSNLSAEAHLTLSKAQLFLNNTNAAAAALASAMRANTNLVVVDPKLKLLLRPKTFRITP